MRRVRGLLRISLSYNILLLFSTDASIYVSFSPSYKGDAVVEVFMLFGTGGREKRIRACTLLQIFPDRIPEMFARFCHNGVGFG